MQSTIRQKDETGIKKMVVFTIFMFLVGTGLELILLSHYEDEWQLIPIILLALGLIAFTILLVRYSSILMSTTRSILVASGLSGLLGTYFHMKANFEFEQEIRSSLPTVELLWESLSGALPALAPMSMIVFTLLGFIYLKIIKENDETI